MEATKKRKLDVGPQESEWYRKAVELHALLSQSGQQQAQEKLAQLVSNVASAFLPSPLVFPPTPPATSETATTPALGARVCMFEDVRCISPRGRMCVEIFPDQVHLRPQTKVKQGVDCPRIIIPLSSFHKCAFQVKKEGASKDMYLGFPLIPPVAHGKKSKIHVFLMQFKPTEELRADLDLTDADAPRLLSSVSGSAVSVMSKILCGLLADTVRVVKEDTEVFSSSKSLTSFKCYYGGPAASGVNEGFLFPLSSGLFFTKPVIFFPKAAVSEMVFARAGSASSRYCDLQIEVGDEEEKHDFTMIPKEEQDPLKRYVSMCSLGEDSDATDGDSDAEPDSDSDGEGHVHSDEEDSDFVEGTGMSDGEDDDDEDFECEGKRELAEDAQYLSSSVNVESRGRGKRKASQKAAGIIKAKLGAEAGDGAE